MKKITIIFVIIFFAAILAFFAIKLSDKKRPDIVLSITVIGDVTKLNYFDDNFLQTSNIENVAKQGIVFGNCYEINTNTNAVISSILSGKNINVGNRNPSMAKSCMTDFIQLFLENDYQIVLVGDWKEYDLKSNNSSFNSFSKKIKILADIDDFKNNGGVKKTEESNELRFYVDRLINYLKGTKDKKPFLIVFYQDISGEKSNLTKPNALGSLSLKMPGIPDVDSGNVQTNLRNQIALSQTADQNVEILTDYLRSVNKFRSTVFVYTTVKGLTGMNNDNFQKMFLSITFSEKVKPELKSAVMCQSTDCLPTILDLAEIKKPSDITGRSLLPVIKNNGSVPNGWRDYVFSNSNGNTDLLAANYNGILTNNYKLIHRYKVDKWELYNLKNDPRGQNNIFYFNQYENIKDSLIYLLEKASRHNL